MGLGWLREGRVCGMGLSVSVVRRVLFGAVWVAFRGGLGEEVAEGLGGCVGCEVERE